MAISTSSSTTRSVLPSWSPDVDLSGAILPSLTKEMLRASRADGLADPFSPFQSITRAGPFEKGMLVSKKSEPSLSPASFYGEITGFAPRSSAPGRLETWALVARGESGAKTAAHLLSDLRPANSFRASEFPWLRPEIFDLPFESRALECPHLDKLRHLRVDMPVRLCNALGRPLEAAPEGRVMAFVPAQLEKDYVSFAALVQHKSGQHPVSYGIDLLYPA